MPLQAGSHGRVQFRMSAVAHHVAHRIIMVAQDGENALRSRKSPNDGRNTVHVPKAGVDEIAGQGNQIRCLAIGEIHRFPKVGGRNPMAGVEIAELNDAITIELGRQVGNANLMMRQLEPRWLDVPAKSNAGPITAQPLGPPARTVAMWAGANCANSAHECRRQLKRLLQTRSPAHGVRHRFSFME